MGAGYNGIRAGNAVGACPGSTASRCTIECDAAATVVVTAGNLTHCARGCARPIASCGLLPAAPIVAQRFCLGAPAAQRILLKANGIVETKSIHFLGIPFIAAATASTRGSVCLGASACSSTTTSSGCSSSGGCIIVVVITIVVTAASGGYSGTASCAACSGIGSVIVAAVAIRQLEVWL